MMDERLSENAEECLEAMYKITRNGKRVSTSALTEKLNVSPSSVTKMLKRLDEKGYVDYSPGKGTNLTRKGIRNARRITRKHRLLERFLHDFLKLRRDRIHDQACEMEHSLSDDAEMALCQVLGFPDRCPDDQQPIPPCDFEFSSCEECMERREKGIDEVNLRKSDTMSLADMKEGESGRVVFVRGDHKVMRRLLDMGITPGTTVRVLKIAPLGGPVEISVRGSSIALGRSIASNIFVDPDKSE